MSAQLNGEFASIQINLCIIWNSIHSSFGWMFVVRLSQDFQILSEILRNNRLQQAFQLLIYHLCDSI